jgi:hypothetical protein
MKMINVELGLLIFGCFVILGKTNKNSRLEGVLDLYKITSQMGDPGIASSSEDFASFSEGFASSREDFASSNKGFASFGEECRIHVIF